MKLPYPVDVKNLRALPVFFSCVPVDLLDNDNRPILEGRSISHKPAESDYSVCHYQGRRKKHTYPMNKEALKIAWRHSDEIISTLKKLHFHTRMMKNFQPDEVTKADRLYAIALSGFKSANYHLADSVLKEVDFSYPPYLSALSKICHGLCHLIYSCDKRVINYCYENNKIDELYRYIDDKEILIGQQSKEVCAGPAAMIKKILSIMMDDNQVEESFSDRTHVKYYHYASITSLFELLSCHYEFYNLCHCRNRGKAIQKKYTIPYSHYLYDAERSHVVKDIPILRELADRAWYEQENAQWAVEIRMVLKKIEHGIESRNFDQQKTIDSDCQELFGKFNSRLYQLFSFEKEREVFLPRASYFFNNDF
ncbi:hypothetical protein WH279_13745 [Erwinia sp. MYb375]|uniref:hypothetical protein n=1 Tax=unclassified Erwinia TaxID=2622719 RepID=UPI0030A7547D